MLLNLLNKYLIYFWKKCHKIEEIKKHLLEIDGIEDIHHIHIWSLDGINNYATMHVVIKNNDLENIKKKVKEEMMEHGISHTTIEVETNDIQCLDVECSSEITHHHHHHH